MPVEWTKDIDAALAAARTGNRNVLMDFNAAPM
jgi:hypothetical protein